MHKIDKYYLEYRLDRPSFTKTISTQKYFYHTFMAFWTGLVIMRYLVLVYIDNNKSYMSGCLLCTFEILKISWFVIRICFSYIEILFLPTNILRSLGYKSIPVSFSIFSPTWPPRCISSKKLWYFVLDNHFHAQNGSTTNCQLRKTNGSRKGSSFPFLAQPSVYRF